MCCKPADRATGRSAIPPWICLADVTHGTAHNGAEIKSGCNTPSHWTARDCNRPNHDTETCTQTTSCTTSSTSNCTADQTRKLVLIVIQASTHCCARATTNSGWIQS